VTRTPPPTWAPERWRRAAEDDRRRGVLVPDEELVGRVPARTGLDLDGQLVAVVAIDLLEALAQSHADASRCTSITVHRSAS
jgi:hypothetical protein